jgi:hypothetical protein
MADGKLVKIGGMQLPIVDVFEKTTVSVSRDGVCVSEVGGTVLRRYFWDHVRCRDLSTGEALTLRMPLLRGLQFR